MNLSSFFPQEFSQRLLKTACLLVSFLTILASPSFAAEPSRPLPETLIRLSEGPDSPVPRWILADQGAGEAVLDINLSSLRLVETEANGQRWQSVEIPEASIHGQVGEPGLPVVSRLITVPRGMTLEVEVLEAASHHLHDLQILPVQDPAGENFSPLNTRIQTPHQSFPQTPVIQVGKTAIMAGTTVVPLSLEMMHYDPARGQALVWSDVKLRIKTVTDANAPQHSKRSERALPSSFHSALGTQVLDLDQAALNLSQPQSSLGTYVAVHNGSSTVINGIAPLLEWRSQQGYHVVSLDTGIIGGSNSAIKTALQGVYDDDTIPPLEFITIFGDATGSYSVPAWNETLSGYNGGGDHYYSMLEGDDILADAHIGRVSFGSSTEMTTIINKILGYEKNPPMDDTTWFGRACLQGDPSASGITTIFVNQWLKGQLLSLGWSQVDTTWSGNFVAPMMASVNQGASAYGYRGYLGTSGISNGHVSSLNNGGKLAIALLPTCDSGSFTSSTSRSEAWLRAPNGGAVAAIGTATTGTHTRYNNCYYLGTWDGLLNAGDSRIGAAHTLGKAALYSGYYLAEPSRAEIWAVWNSVMGDGATPMWTSVPKVLAVDHPVEISLGNQAVAITVSHDGQAVPGAHVTLYRQGGLELDDFQLSATTDANGQVILDLPGQTPGSLNLTVTGQNLLPYTNGITVGQANVSCTVFGFENSGTFEPGANLQITPTLHNFGATDAFGVTAAVTVHSGPASLSGGDLSFGTIGAGSEAAATSALSLVLDDDASDGSLVRLMVSATNGQDTWNSFINGIVESAAFSVISLDLGEFGGSVDPGESGILGVSLANVGSQNATGVAAILSTDCPWVNLIDDSSSFGNIVIGGSGSDLLSPFRINISSDCYGGTLANFNLSVSYSDGRQASTHFALTLGTATSDQPTGPDAYGYYAIDNTDTVTGLAPVYEWVGIDPDHGAQGTDLGLTDFGWEQDDTKTINLPFSFNFYGESYSDISICSNGWLAMGETPVNFYRNFPLPASHSAGALIAPFWDNLIQTGNKRVYTWYDEQQHRFIIQWYGLVNHFSNLPQNFEVILFDPLHHPTATGDGMILFQYEEVNNTDSRDGYATVGIQNLDRTMGLNYSYWNQYAGGAATLASGRAILIAPLGDIALPAASITPGDMTVQLDPDAVETQYLHIANNGDEGSNLTFNLTAVDPLTMALGKNAGQGQEPEVDERSLAGSQVSTSVLNYLAGTTIDLPLNVTCNSPDDEWLLIIELSVPAGVTVNSGEDFPTDHMPIEWNGETGNGLATTWGSEFSGSGALLMNGESSSSSVNLTFDPGLNEEVVLMWTVSGDNFGNPPHQVSGELVLAPIGPSISVLTPDSGTVAVLGAELSVDFVVSNGPELVKIALQRELDGPWQNLIFALPANNAPWSWVVSGEPGPYARIRVSDVADANVFGLSGVFAIGRNLDWIQPGTLSGEVPSGQTLDVPITLDATGLTQGVFEANLVIESNGGPAVTVPVSMSVGGMAAADDLPNRVTLLGNHPNPFNPSTSISFSLPSAQKVNLKIYSARGQLVRSLLQGTQPAGLHHAVWDGRNDNGQGTASGVYFYRLETDEGNFTGKMVLTK